MEDVIIEFTGGGPLDGKVVATDDGAEVDANKARWFLMLAGASLDIAERKEQKAGTLITWLQPSAALSERAKAEAWTDARTRALLQYHEYAIAEYAAEDGIVLFTARYQGVV